MESRKFRKVRIQKFINLKKTNLENLATNKKMKSRKLRKIRIQKIYKSKQKENPENSESRKK